MSTTIDATVRAQLARYVRIFTPDWMREQHEDLVQMAAMRVIRAGAHIEHVPAYLRQTAYTTVLDEIRRRRTRRESRLNTSFADRAADLRTVSPESRQYGKQLDKAIESALSTLGDDRREAVALYLQHTPVPRIAKALGCNRKRASNLVYRGLADLRNVLASGGITP